MKKSDFYFDLPEELIAQTPLERRDASRLLTLDKTTGAVAHHHFYELPQFLRPNDCLVLNDSRVLPARLLGHRSTGGAVEVLLLRDLGDGKWECLTRPGRKTQPGTALSFGDGELTATVVDAIADGNKIVQFHYDGIFLEVLERLGKMPLPPYIKAELQDQERYQTVYSRELGSAAAPTAGLHFTKELLQQIADMGVKIGYVTLHVGLGTFRPVKEDEIEDHPMHSEFCIIPEETARMVNETKANGGRVICIGTTSCRTVESFADADGTLRAQSGWTDIFNSSAWMRLSRISTCRRARSSCSYRRWPDGSISSTHIRSPLKTATGSSRLGMRCSLRTDSMPAAANEEIKKQARDRKPVFLLDRFSFAQLQMPAADRR